MRRTENLNFSNGLSSENSLPGSTHGTSQEPFRFSESLKQVFSILPEKQAIEAQQKALQNYVGSGNKLEAEIKWADFTEKGQFTGGGATDIAGFSIRLAANVSTDPGIARLAALAIDGGIRAGLMEYCVSENAIIWFLPKLSKIENGIPQASIRGLFIPEAIVHEILDIFNVGAMLTPAEKHLIFQLSAGLSLRNAAESDRLAFETKRAQLKTACSKLQCGGQTDLLRHVLSQMTYLLSLCEVQNDRSAEVDKFVQKYLSLDARITVQRLSNGGSIRILERGPANGTPVLVIHGMLWPLLFLTTSDVLAKHNIKMIVPLRSGYLDNQSAHDIYGTTDMVARSLEDIARYQSECCVGKMPVIGHSYGSVLAIEYARLFPDMVSKLSLVAINTVEPTSANKNFIGNLFVGLQSLSNKPGIFRYLTWQFKKYYVDEKTVKPILQNMFAASATDYDLIEGKGDTKAIYPWFVELYQKSIPGIADDFKFALGNPKKILKEVEADIMFVHGDEDPLVESQVVEGYADSVENAKVEIIAGAGHHLFNTHEEELWEIVINQ